MSSSLVVSPYYLNHTNTEDRNMLQSKLSRGKLMDDIATYSPSLRNAVTSSRLMAFPYYLNHTNTEDRNMLQSKLSRTRACR